jgi:hypothetical protein
MTTGDSGWPELADCEEEIGADGVELLWRQVKRNQIDETDGHVTGDAFQEDGQRVSVSRSTVVSPAQAFTYHTNVGRQSAGTWAVSVAEVGEAACRVIDDSACEDVDTPGHAYIDMRHLAGDGKQVKNLRRSVRATLAIRASARGRQYP